MAQLGYDYGILRTRGCVGMGVCMCMLVFIESLMVSLINI